MANFLGIPAIRMGWRAGVQQLRHLSRALCFLRPPDVQGSQKGIKQFVYNLNVPARWGQSPFTNITLDINPPEDLRKQVPTKKDLPLFRNVDNAELLAEAQRRDMGLRSLAEMTYGHFAPEMGDDRPRLLRSDDGGDSTGQPFTFPMPRR